MFINRIKQIERDLQFTYISGSEIYLNLFHVIENTAKQKRGRLLYFRRYWNHKHTKTLAGCWVKPNAEELHAKNLSGFESDFSTTDTSHFSNAISKTFYNFSL